MSSEFTFTANKVCPICEQSTRIIKIKANVPVERVDEDFCNHYKSTFNPYFYHVWVCEHCGFAGDEKNFLSAMPMKHKEAIRRKLLVEQKIKFDFMEERHMPEAVSSYRLAFLFAEMRNTPLHQQGSIVLRIAWLYRFSEEHEKEREYLQKALKLFIRAETEDRFPQGNVTEYDIKYLIAAIAYRVQDNELCRKYLKKLLAQKDLRQLSPKVYELSNAIWEYVKADDPEEKAAAEKAAKAAAKSGKKERSSRFRF